jgi:hypothetical protein
MRELETVIVLVVAGVIRAIGTRRSILSGIPRERRDRSTTQSYDSLRQSGCSGRGSEYDFATHLQLSGRVRQTVTEWTVLRCNNPEVCVADVPRRGSKDWMVENIEGFSSKFNSLFSPKWE